MFDIGSVVDRVRDRVFQPLADAIDARFGIGPVRVTALTGMLVAGTQAVKAVGFDAAGDGSDMLDVPWASAALMAVVLFGSLRLLAVDARASGGHGPWFHPTLRAMAPLFVVMLPLSLVDSCRLAWLAAASGHGVAGVVHLAVNLIAGAGLVVGGCVWNRPGPRTRTRMVPAGA